MKKALYSLVFAAMLVSYAAADNYYVDVIESESPPWALKWLTVPFQVNVWDHGNLSNSSYRSVGVMLGQGRSTESKHSLRGNPTWNAAIGAGSKRLRGYDGNWYRISWGHVSSNYNPGIAIATSLHPRFTWKLDPDY